MNPPVDSCTVSQYVLFTADSVLESIVLRPRNYLQGRIISFNQLSQIQKTKRTAESFYCCTVRYGLTEFIIHQRMHCYIVIVQNLCTETLKMLLHVSTLRSRYGSVHCSLLKLYVNTFAASYLNTQGLNNSCLKSRQRRPYSI